MCPFNIINRMLKRDQVNQSGVGKDDVQWRERHNKSV